MAAEILDFNIKTNKKLVLALGFFDGVHIGHRAILNAAAALADKTGASMAAFTFKNLPAAFFKPDAKAVYSYNERLLRLVGAGAEYIVTARFDAEFAAISPRGFLETLSANFELCGLVCGTDYTYGAGGKAGVSELTEFCAGRGIAFESVDLVRRFEEKVSSTALRRLISCGDIETANLLLGAPYLVCGSVEKGRGVGRTLGTPTANIIPPPEKLRLKEGVYITKAFIGVRTYRALTNAGGSPTYGESGFSYETYIEGFSGDIYGAEIKLEFFKRLRGLIGFSGSKELKAQIFKDREALAAYEY